MVKPGTLNGTEEFKLFAVLANTAYGVGVKFCAGSNALKPFTPSLNQIRNCKCGCAKNALSIAAMFGIVASPKVTVNKPLLTFTLTAADGSLPSLLVWSLLQ